MRRHQWPAISHLRPAVLTLKGQLSKWVGQENLFHIQQCVRVAQKKQKSCFLYNEHYLRDINLIGSLFGLNR